MDNVEPRIRIRTRQSISGAIRTRQSINEARNQDLMLALRHGVPTILVDCFYLNLVEFPELTSMDYLLMEACSEYLPMSSKLNAYCTLLARPLISAAIMATRYLPTLSPDELLARKLFMIYGIDLKRGEMSDEAVLESRQKINEILLSRMPLKTDLMKAAGSMLEACKNVKEQQLIPGTTAASVIPDWDNAKDCSAQTFTFYKRFGHCLSKMVFTSEAMANLWGMLADPNIPYVNLTWIDISTEITTETLNGAWSVYNVNNIIGLYDFLGANLRSVATNQICASIFAYVMSIEKKFFSDTWIEFMRKFFKSTPPNFSIESILKEPVLEHYAFLVSRDIVDTKKFYGSLYNIISPAIRYGMNSIHLFIKQSAMANTIFARIISSTVVRMRFFDIEVLIKMGIPDADVVNFLTLVLAVLRAPFHTFIKIHKNVFDYPHLAYVCNYLARNCIREDFPYAYCGDVLNHCFLKMADMNNMAKVYYEAHQTLESRGMTFLLPALNRTAKEAEINGRLRPNLTPTEERAECLLAGKRALEQLEPREEKLKLPGEENIEDQLDEAARVRAKIAKVKADRFKWTQRKQQIQFKLLSEQEIVDHIKAGRTHRSIAFNEICSRMFKTSEQRINTNEQSLISPSCFYQITNEDVCMFALWNITVPREYTQVDPYTPDEGNRYFIAPKKCVDAPNDNLDDTTPLQNKPSDGVPDLKICLIENPPPNN